jgi:antitoxin VapB
LSGYTLRIYTPQRRPWVVFARVFKSGTSQAVRLPKEFRLEVDRVEIFRRGNELVLRERPASAGAVLDVLAKFPDDFMADGRDDAVPQEREPL